MALACNAALSITGVAYAIGALVLATVSGHFRPASSTSAQQPILVDVRVGITYLWGHEVLRRLALLVGALSVASRAGDAIFVVYAVAPGPMQLHEFEFGLLLTSIAAGAVLASLTAERVERVLGRARTLQLTIVASAASTAAPLLLNPWLAAVLFFTGGYMIVTWNVITVTLRQQLVPDDILGRTNATYRLLAWGGGPLGAAAGGVLAELTQPAVVFGLAALATVALLPAMRPLTNDALAHASNA